jgi:uncharacterized protein (TIGR02145 family)
MKKITLIFIVSFKSLIFSQKISLMPSIKDVDNNLYKTILIGNQQWMAENLKTSKFNDGSLIPNVKENNIWRDLKTPAWAHYNNDTTNNKSYGKLYNWYSVNSFTNENKNICPIGWHVPNDDDWTILTNLLGGIKNAGGKMKEEGTISWKIPNSGATNSSLFNALPGSGREYDGSFNSLGELGCWWSSTDRNLDNAWCRYLNYNKEQVDRYYVNKAVGFSIRCIKD